MSNKAGSSAAKVDEIRYCGTDKSSTVEVSDIYASDKQGRGEKVYPEDLLRLNNSVTDDFDIPNLLNYSKNLRGYFHIEGNSQEHWTLSGAPSWMSITGSGEIKGYAPKLGSSNNVPYQIHNVTATVRKGDQTVTTNRFRFMSQANGDYFRIYLSRPHNGKSRMNLEEVQIKDANGTIFSYADKQQYAASSIFEGNPVKYGPKNAFEYMSREWWETDNESMHWIQVATHQHHKPKSISIRLRDDNFHDRAPQTLSMDMYIKGSWVTVFSKTTAAYWSRHESRSWNIF